MIRPDIAYDYRDHQIYEFTTCRRCIAFRRATKIHNYRCSDCDLAVIANLDAKIANAARKHYRAMFGFLIKFGIIALATAAAFLLVPLFFPSLHKLAFDNASGITWSMVLALTVLVVGTWKLAAK